MTKNTRFSPEVRQRAVRMVLESQGEYDSQWAAICKRQRSTVLTLIYW
ncbi:Transposase [Escherichia coli]|nr:ORFa1203 [Escherichia coli]